MSETKKENTEELVGKDTIKRLSTTYHISMEDVSRRIQAYFKAKEFLDPCSGGDMLHLEDFFPKPVEVDSLEKVYDMLEERKKTEKKAKRERNAMRGVHDQLREKMGMSSIDWEH